MWFVKDYNYHYILFSPHNQNHMNNKWKYYDRLYIIHYIIYVHDNIQRENINYKHVFSYALD